MHTIFSDKLYTIGYEGLTTINFLSLLRSYEIERLIDVRELPLSRKKGFSKGALHTLLAENEIEYVHLKALGCPKPIRHTYRLDGNWEHYTEQFWQYLYTQDAAMQSLNELTQQKRCVLLCFEADPRYCHRSLVAQYLRQRWNPQIKVISITAERLTSPNRTWIIAGDNSMRLSADRSVI